MTTRKKELLAELENMISRALSVRLGDLAGNSLLFIVQRFLLSYRLNGLINPEDVLTEAYLRARKAIEEKNKEDILDMKAWFQVICLNIVKEHSTASQKDRDKQKRMQHESQSDVSICISAQDQYRHEQWSKELASGLRSLKAEEQHIIDLRFVRDLPWAEVTQILNEQNNGNFKVERVRQRGRRALKKLRAAFFVNIEQAAS